MPKKDAAAPTAEAPADVEEAAAETVACAWCGHEVEPGICPHCGHHSDGTLSGAEAPAEE